MARTRKAYEAPRSYDHALDDKIAKMEADLVELRRRRRGAIINGYGWRWCVACGGDRVLVPEDRPWEVWCSACTKAILDAIEQMFAARCWGCLGRFGEHVRPDCPARQDPTKGI